VTYFPRPAERTLAAVDAASERILREAMTDPDPVFLSTLRVAGERLLRRDPGLRGGGADQARILRSVLMKPEHEHYVEILHRQLARFAAADERGGHTL